MTNDSNPLVTIVTVTYNSSKYVRDAIESVLAQTYSNIEYIIGDDCSTDNTWEIIQEYKDPRIKAYRNEKNLGEYPNRNEAIKIATGDYFMFIDGDDVIYSHGIEYFVGIMQDFPQAGMAIQKGYCNNMLYPALFTPAELLRNYFYGKVNLLSSSFASNFFKTELLKDGMLCTEYLSGDAEIRLRISVQYPTLFVAGWVSWPRETPGQASSKIFNNVISKEYLKYTQDILNSKVVEHLDPDLLNDFKGIVKRKGARYILKMLFSGEIKHSREFLNSFDFSWGDVLKFYNYKATNEDILLSYSPAAPYKKGFLK